MREFRFPEIIFFSQIFHPYPTTLFYHMQQSTQATFFQKEIFQISLSKGEGIRCLCYCYHSMLVL